jgi:hypothetical protein
MTIISTTEFHLAQFNFARARFQPRDARMKGFVDALVEINQLSERAPGFVWRLQTEAGHSIDVRAFPDDDLKLITLSVWKDVESLRQFVYRGGHLAFLKRRETWFEASREPYLVLWWTDGNHIPSVSEGMDRLRHLTRFGPSPHAFDFRTVFGATGHPLTSGAPQPEERHRIAEG